MSETNTRRTLSDFLGLPNGREEYIKFMVAYEAAENPDLRYTQQENEELFGLQFDLAAKSRELDRRLISQEDFDKYKTEHDERVDQIVAKSRARNAAAKEAWQIHDRAEMMMNLGQDSPNAKQLEAASLSIEDNQIKIDEVKKATAEVLSHVGRLERSVDAMQALTEHITGVKMGDATGAAEPQSEASEKGQEAATLASYGISRDKAIKIGDEDLSAAEDAIKVELPNKLHNMVESLQGSLDRLGIDHEKSKRYIPVLQRWLLMTLCNGNLRKIVEQARQIDAHLHGAGSEIKADELFRSEPVKGDPLEKAVVPKWHEEIFECSYLFSWKYEGAKSFYLTGESTQQGACLISGYARSEDDVVKRLFEKDAATLPIGTIIFTEIPMMAIASGDYENKKTSLSVKDDVVTVEFNREEGWDALLNSARGELPIEIRKIQLAQDGEGKKTLTLTIPQMSSLSSDELVLHEGEMVVLEPRRPEISGFYDADVVYGGGILSIDARTKGDKRIKHQIAIPEFDVEKVNGQLLSFLFKAGTLLEDRLSAMNGLYVKPESFNKTKL